MTQKQAKWTRQILLSRKSGRTRLRAGTEKRRVTRNFGGALRYLVHLLVDIGPHRGHKPYN
jgi:hypothetical protein